MKHSLKTSLILITTLILSACQTSLPSKVSSKAESAADDPSKIVVSTYSGGEVTLKDVNIELEKLIIKNEKLKGLTFDKLSSDQKEAIIKEAVLKEMAYKEAKKRSLNKDKEYREAIKLFESELFSKYMDTFINPKTGEVDKNSVIKFGVSMDGFVENVSNIGGATVGGLDTPMDLIYLAKDSLTGAPFDVKTKLGAFNGYLLNGEYVTGRDVGNYLAGVNGTKAGMPETATMAAAGTLQTYRSIKAGDYISALLAPVSPYYGEAPYSGRMIQEGIRNAQNPPVQNNAPLASIPTSKYFNNANNLLGSSLNYSLPNNQ